MLRFELSFLIELRLLHVVDVRAIRWYGDHDSDEDSDETQTLDGQREPVDLAEDDGKGFEPGVNQAIDKAGVDVEEEDDRLLEVQCESAGGRDGDVVQEVIVLLVNELGLTAKIGAASELAETACAAVEDVGVTCFWEEEEDDDKGETGEPRKLPDRPLPALRLCSEPSDDWA